MSSLGWGRLSKVGNERLILASLAGAVCRGGAHTPPPRAPHPSTSHLPLASPDRAKRNSRRLHPPTAQSATLVARVPRLRKAQLSSLASPTAQSATLLACVPDRAKCDFRRVPRPRKAQLSSIVSPDRARRNPRRLRLCAKRNSRRSRSPSTQRATLVACVSRPRGLQLKQKSGPMLRVM